MSEIVTQLMKGHLCNELPFVMCSSAFHLYPEMLNPSFRQMIWVSLLPQPSRALAGEDVDTLLIPFLLVGMLWEEIVIECPACHIMQIQGPGLAAFGINERDTSGSLIDLALIYPQSRNFTNP